MSVFDAVLGQPEVIKRLEATATHPVHAYLFLGPRGTGAKSAALGLAALLLSDGTEGEVADRHRRLALAAKHPDLVVIEPSGVQFRDEDVKEVVRHATTTPVEGSRKVIVIEEAQAFNDTAVGRLLKLIEEPPPSVHFILLATEVPPQMITISSRCLTVEFGAVPRSIIETALVIEGVEIRRAKAAAAAAGGSLDRARLLANDDALASRAELWTSIPTRVNGSGSTAVELVNQIREALDASQEAVEAQHIAELEALEERVKLTGERGSGRGDLVAKHKREIRRQRTDELRFGLGTLARHYRDRLVVAPDAAAEQAIDAITHAADALTRNPNEPLLLQNLLLGLPSSSAA